MKLKIKAQIEYLNAFAEILSRIQQTLKGSRPDVFPIRMYVAGGAALHLLTGARVSADVDAVFSKRILFNEEIEVSYRDPDGRARLLYLDRNYNDTLGLCMRMRTRSRPIGIPGSTKTHRRLRQSTVSKLSICGSGSRRHSAACPEGLMTRPAAQTGGASARRLCG